MSALQTVKRKMGRPTKYNAQIIAKTIEYLETYENYGHKIPSIAGLSEVLETDRETLHRWAKEENKPEFSNMLNRLMRSQEQKCLSNGLDGTFNPTITKLVLSKHGYTENVQANQGVSITVNVNRDQADVVIEGQKE